VLVGQSVGGNIAWLYASRHATEVAGFLLMNAGPFVAEWDKLADVWTAEEIAAEKALIDERTGLILQQAEPPPAVPYVVMLSTVSQCGSRTDVCGRAYPLHEAWGRELAAQSPNGGFVQVDAGHEIFASRPDAVTEELERILDTAAQ